jgi:hypothetical protein
MEPELVMTMLSDSAEAFFRCGDEIEPRWFDIIEPADNPWRNWFRMLCFPQHGPLDTWIERRIVEDVCRAADRLRLSVTPATARFEATWARFCHHHNTLDESYEYRRKRWLVWRASALRVAHDHGDLPHGDFQDEADFIQCRALLTETLAEFWPGIKPDGSHDRHPGINFWRAECIRADGSKDTDPLGEYAAMVLQLVWTAAGKPRHRTRFLDERYGLSEHP